MGLMKSVKNIAKEIRSFYSFYRELRKDERDIVFYSEDTASYNYFEGLIDYLVDVEGMKVCYITSDISDPLLRQKRKNIKVLYIKSLLPFFTVSLTSKILIMTMPDLHRFHVRRSEFGTHHIYLFHNIGSSFPVIRYGALFHYDAIFCVGPHHFEEIRRQEEIYALPKKNLVEFGYYRVEKIYNEYKKMGNANAGKLCSGCKGIVLLGPSWGKNSILNLFGDKVIGLLLAAGYRVIVRPHPMTKKYDRQLLKGINEKFKENRNYVFEGEISSVDSALNSDLLICDWSGFAYEYAFGMEKPVLFIDVPQKIVNPRYGELGIEPIDKGLRERIGEVVRKDEIGNIVFFAEKMMKNRDTYINSIVEERNRIIYNFLNSSKVGAQYIHNVIAH